MIKKKKSAYLIISAYLSGSNIIFVCSHEIDIPKISYLPP
jgi:hypothetical protein